jgi:hypothetical protein
MVRRMRPGVKRDAMGLVWRGRVGGDEEGEVVDGLLVLDGALVVLKVIDPGLSSVDEARIGTK